MTVAQYFNKYGAVATLRVLGYDDTADKVERWNQFVNKVEGMGGYERFMELADELQALSSELHPYVLEGDKLIWENREKIIENEE